MTKILIATLLTVVLAAHLESQTKRKSQGSRRAVTVALDSWEPERGSLFRKVTRELPVVSKVEVALIQSGLSLDPRSGERLIFQGKEVIRVLKTRTLSGNEAESFAKIWRQLNQGSSNACFAPAYLLKFYSGDQQLFETIVCFHCRNLMLTDGEFWGFDADNPAGSRLLKGLQTVLAPIDERALGADSPGAGFFSEMSRRAGQARR